MDLKKVKISKTSEKEIVYSFIKGSLTSFFPMPLKVPQLMGSH